MHNILLFSFKNVSEPKKSVEEPSEVRISIRKDGPTNNTVTLKYQTVDGTATAGSDYEAIVSGEITFNNGELLKEVTVRVLDDSEAEGAETFFLQVYEIIGELKCFPENMSSINLGGESEWGVLPGTRSILQHVMHPKFGNIT